MGALPAHGQAHGGAQAAASGDLDQAGATRPLQGQGVGDIPQEGGQSGRQGGVERPLGHVRGHPELGGEEAGTSPSHARDRPHRRHQGAARVHGGGGAEREGGGTRACHRRRAGLQRDLNP